MNNRENKLRVHNFDTISYNDKLLRANNDLIEARHYVSALKTFDGCNNIEDVEKQLLKKTGFKNTRMSSQLLDVEHNYIIVKNNIIEDFTVFNEDYTELSNAFIDGLKESCTTYYTAEETKDLDNIDKIITALNKLRSQFRGSLETHRDGTLTFNIKKYNYLKQMR